MSRSAASDAGVLADRLSGFVSQFSGPTGWRGHLAGLFMARMNGPLNGWVIETLDVGADDSVLEVGFGPGLAVALAAARASRGHVSGIDKSAVMLRHAGLRNRRAVRAGRVDLRLGAPEALPFADQSFTRACAVNSLQFWADTAGALAELYRVMRPEGRLVLAQRLRSEGVGRYDRRRYGMTEERLEGLVRQVTARGFQVEGVERREIREETIAALIAGRPRASQG